MRMTIQRGHARLTLPLLLVGLLATTAPAASDAQVAPLKVYVNHSGDDSVGAALAFNVRELLHDSRLYPLSARSDDAQVEISIVTLDLDASNKGISSAVSLALLLKNGTDTMLRQGVRIVGTDRTKTMAKSIVGDLDNTVADLRRSVDAPRSTQSPSAGTQRTWSTPDPAFDESKLPFDANANEANRYFADMAKDVFMMKSQIADLTRRLAELERR